MHTKSVQIILRDGWAMSTPLVEVLWECPTCGESMGEPKGHNFHEDGDWYHCNVWDNPCGHVAKYDELKIKRKDETFVTWKEMKANKVKEVK